MRIALSNRVTCVLLASATALLAAGCGSDPLAPSAVAGTYVLLSIDGNPLPADAGYSGPADEAIEVVADTLRLAADGSGSIVTVQETLDYPAAGDTSRARFESALHFTTSEGGIAITYDCPANALMLCIAGPHMTARLSAAGLSATRLTGSRPQELVYAPVQRLD